jgi:hypothetical protein
VGKIRWNSPLPIVRVLANQKTLPMFSKKKKNDKVG